jgi:hypothetical protein
MCHRTVTSIRATWDARFQTPLEEQGVLLDVLSGEAQHPTGSPVVAPGSGERSAMWQRAPSADQALRMPPLGHQRIHSARREPEPDDERYRSCWCNH